MRFKYLGNNGTETALSANGKGKGNVCTFSTRSCHLCPVSNSSSSAMPKGQFRGNVEGQRRQCACSAFSSIQQVTLSTGLPRAERLSSVPSTARDGQGFLSPRLYLSTASWWRKARVNSLYLSTAAWWRKARVNSLYLSTASWWRKAGVNSLSVSAYRLVVTGSKG